MMDELARTFLAVWGVLLLGCVALAALVLGVVGVIRVIEARPEIGIPLSVVAMTGLWAIIITCVSSREHAS